MGSDSGFVSLVTLMFKSTYTWIVIIILCDCIVSNICVFVCQPDKSFRAISFISLCLQI